MKQFGWQMAGYSMPAMQRQERHVQRVRCTDPRQTADVSINRCCVGSLTSRGMPLMLGLQHLGGKQTRAAAQRGCERRCVTSAAVAELSRRRNL